MKGKMSFTTKEMEKIIDLIEQKVVASKNEQRNIRNKIRSLGFYFSDFSNKKGYTVDDFKDLIQACICQPKSVPYNNRKLYHLG